MGNPRRISRSGFISNGTPAAGYDRSRRSASRKKHIPGTHWTAMTPFELLIKNPGWTDLCEAISRLLGIPGTAKSGDL